jgi:hypothetical protein
MGGSNTNLNWKRRKHEESETPMRGRYRDDPWAILRISTQDNGPLDWKKVEAHDEEKKYQDWYGVHYEGCIFLVAHPDHFVWDEKIHVYPESEGFNITLNSYPSRMNAYDVLMHVKSYERGGKNAL